MTEPQAHTITVGKGGEARDIAVLARGCASPGLVWLGGFASDMTGSKAEALDAFAARKGLAFTRFDYSGHGRSSGRFEDGTISRWLEESLAVFDATTGPQILVGSSMGGWMALLLARAHRAAVDAERSRIAGLVLIAPAVDMTRALMWEEMTRKQRAELTGTGSIRVTSDYDAEGYLITRALIEDGTISGGMIPKIESCISVVQNGVEAVVIINGKVQHGVLLELFTEHGAGTLLAAS